MFWLRNKKRNQFSTLIWRHSSSVGGLQFLCPNISSKHSRYPNCKSSCYHGIFSEIKKKVDLNTSCIVDAVHVSIIYKVMKYRKF